MSLRVGIVGAGMIAAVHRDAIAMADGCTLTGVHDRGTGRGESIAPGLDRTGADDLEAFAARGDIDMLSVATPSGVHLDAALAAARHGKHCLVEKPMEIDVARIDRMIDAHDEAGTALGGIFNTRYTEAAQLLKCAVETGRFGQLTCASAVCPWWRDQSYYEDSDWKGTLAMDGGGALMNQGIHSIDLLQWVVGSPVVRVSGRIATLVHPGVEAEDTGAAVIEFENGALGNVTCTTSMWPGHFRTITVAGDAGTAVLADGNLLEWRFRAENAGDDEIRQRLMGLPGAGVGASDPSAGVDAHGHHAVLREFAAAVAAGAPPPIDGFEARKAVAIIEAVYASSASGTAVNVTHRARAR